MSTEVDDARESAESGTTEAAQPETREATGAEETRGEAYEWRKRKAAALAKSRERRAHEVDGLEMRQQDDGSLTLVGYACVTNAEYDVGWYREVILPGAFRRTLGEQPPPDVQLLVNHTGTPLARTRSGTMTLVEDEKGLRVEADLDPLDPDVISLQRKMARGDIDQMSFAFQATDDEWDDSFSTRTLRAVSIHRGDVSVVNQGANDRTSAMLRSQQDALAELHRIGPEAFIAAFAEWRDHTLLPLEQRAGKALSSATMEVLSQVLNLVAAADDAVDEAQPLLADLMGVPNPDADDEGSDETEPDADDAGAQRSVVIPDLTTRARQELDALTLRKVRR